MQMLYTLLIPALVSFMGSTAYANNEPKTYRFELETDQAYFGEEPLRAYFELVFSKDGIVPEIKVLQVDEDEYELFIIVRNENKDFMTSLLNGGGDGSGVFFDRETGDLIFDGDSDGASSAELRLYRNSDYTRGYLKLGGTEWDPWYSKVTCTRKLVSGA